MGAGHQVGRFKVSLCLGEIEGRDRERYRDRETYKQRDRETELTIKFQAKPGSLTSTLKR